MRIGAHRKNIPFDDADVELLKSTMEQRLISNSDREAAKFWEKFCEVCAALNPTLLDPTTRGLGENPTFKESQSISINSQNIGWLHSLSALAISLNAEADVKNALELLISASDAVRNRKTYPSFTLAQMMYNLSASSQNLLMEKTKKWLEHVKEGG